MTLTPFPPAACDELALRLLDVAAAVRRMASLSREHELAAFRLHANKAHEWLRQLEDWAQDGVDRLETEAIRQRGARRAQAALSPAIARRNKPRK